MSRHKQGDAKLYFRVYFENIFHWQHFEHVLILCLPLCSRRRVEMSNYVYIVLGSERYCVWNALPTWHFAIPKMKFLNKRLNADCFVVREYKPQDIFKNGTYLKKLERSIKMKD